MEKAILDTLVAKNTAPDGWRPAYDRTFIDRGGLIFLGVAAPLILAGFLPGKAAYFAAVYAAYFVARLVEHGWVRSQFWLSATAYGVAAVALVVPTYLWIDPVAAAVMVGSMVMAVLIGVGRRIHPTWAMVLFAVPLALWCLGDARLPWSIEGQRTADIVALIALGIALFVLSLSRRDERHALAERIAGRVRLDSGEVYAMDRDRVLRLGSRLHHEDASFSTRVRQEPAVRFTVLTGPLGCATRGRTWIARRGSDRLPPANGSELHRTVGGVPFVAAFERPSVLTEALATGVLDEALTGLAHLPDPFVVIEGGELRIETTGRGDDTDEALVRIGRAFAAKTETAPRGAYR